MVFPGSSASKESFCTAEDPGSIPGLGRSPGEGIGYSIQYSCASLVAQMVKNLPAKWEKSLIPGSRSSPGEEHGNSLQYSCLENPHRQRNLAGYAPWGRKGSAMTEWLSTVQHNRFYRWRAESGCPVGLWWDGSWSWCSEEVWGAGYAPLHLHLVLGILHVVSQPGRLWISSYCGDFRAIKLFTWRLRAVVQEF